MKNFIFGLAVSLGLLMIVALSPQEPHREFNTILSDAGDYRTITSSDTTQAFSIKGYKGAITILVEADTTTGEASSTNPDSCMTVGMQIWSEGKGKWFDYYRGAVVFKGDGTLGTLPQSVLDTRPRSIINTGGSNVYMTLPAFENNAWGEKARLWFSIGDGDKTKLRISEGGQ